MAKARFCKGLRRGSTKTETYSTLATAKEGRIQIIKDRVTDVANPQTDAQMVNRVIFATVTQAAAKMAELIETSFEGVQSGAYSRQAFIKANTEFLNKVAGRRAGINNHWLAAYAPKGNTQLIPNSYIVSKGSLTVPGNLVPKNDANMSFGLPVWGSPSNVNIPYGTYTVAQLWQLLYNLLPGDQLTAVAVYGDGPAQILYQGDSEESAEIDKTIYTSWAAARIVLKSEMPATTVTFAAEDGADEDAVRAALLSGISQDDSLATLVDNFLAALTLDDVAEQYTFSFADYDDMYEISNDDVLRGLGVILSRYNSNKQMWQYSTSQLMCVWDFLGNNSGNDYFGFTLANAIASYKSTARVTSSGIFLQSGGSADIVPTSFT